MDELCTGWDQAMAMLHSRWADESAGSWQWQPTGTDCACELMYDMGHYRTVCWLQAFFDTRHITKGGARSISARPKMKASTLLTLSHSQALGAMETYLTARVYVYPRALHISVV